MSTLVLLKKKEKMATPFPYVPCQELFEGWIFSLPKHPEAVVLAVAVSVLTLIQLEPFQVLRLLLLYLTMSACITGFVFVFELRVKFLGEHPDYVFDEEAMKVVPFIFLEAAAKAGMAWPYTGYFYLVRYLLTPLFLLGVDHLVPKKQ